MIKMLKKIWPIISIVALIISLSGCRAADYKRGQKLAEEGKYKEAAVEFTALGNYKDSQERAIVLQLKQLILDFGQAGEELELLTVTNYDADVQQLETVAEKMEEFTERFSDSDFSQDDDIAAVVDKINIGGQGILLLIEMNREYIDQIDSSAFTVLSDETRAYLENSKDAFKSICKQMQAEEFPSKYSGWF